MHSLLVLATALFVMVVAGQDALTVNTENGPVRGKLSTDGKTRVWHGIPFAEPPLGENRLRPPKRLSQTWSSPRDATYVRESCIQFVELDGFFHVGDEDCLYLSVYSPLSGNNTDTVATKKDSDSETESAKALKPVMVWIYGGGFVMGSNTEGGGEPLLAGGLYNAQHIVGQHDYVHVAMNYRLSALGFLALDAEETDPAGESYGNFGVLDQRAAMQWVQRNIKQFGGDPNHVTIFGESAGAFSVCFHLVSPDSRGLFHAAILESGTCSSPAFFYPLEKAREFGREYSKQVGCGQADTKERNACLRKLNAVDLMNGKARGAESKATTRTQNGKRSARSSSAALTTVEAARRNWHIGESVTRAAIVANNNNNNNNNEKNANQWYPLLYPAMSWGPPVDGTNMGLPDVPYKLIEAGKTAALKSVIMGSNEDEGVIFVLIIPNVVHGVDFPLDRKSTVKAMEKFFNATVAERVVTMYDPMSDTYESLVSHVLRDYFFACEARRVVTQLTKHGVPSYLYHFQYQPEWLDTRFLGDYHSTELYFVFDNGFPPIVHSFSAKDQRVADTFGHYWYDGMGKHFDPNAHQAGSKVLHWPAYNATQRVTMVLDDPPYHMHDYRAAYCDYFDHVHAKPWVSP